MKELEKNIIKLEKSLYHNNQEITDFNKIDVQKNLFSLIRECIKEKNYIVNVGSYEFNINPSNLSVKYENDETVVEISSEDVYYETTRETEARFFVIADEDKEIYPSDSKVIKVTGIVTNIDGMCDEHYQFELFNDDNNIKNYLSLIDGAEYQAKDIETNSSVIIRKEIFISNPRTDVTNFFSNSNIIPVTYNLYEDNYVKNIVEKEYIPNNYSLLIPTLDKEKSNVSFLYNSIVDYYTEYLNKN